MLGCHRTRKNQFSRFTIFVNKELRRYEFSPRDRSEWIHTPLGTINKTPTQLQRGQTRNSEWKTNTHTDTNGTVYMVIWFSFSFFGRYGYLDFLQIQFLVFFSLEKQFTTCARFSTLQLDWVKFQIATELVFRLLCLHTLSPAGRWQKWKGVIKWRSLSIWFHKQQS